MPTPIITWWKQDNTEQLTVLDFGTVDAGSVSPATTVLIWNNRGGQTAVSDMTNCMITAKDSAGGNTGEVITNTWTEVRVDSLSETAFAPIGGTVMRPIKASGSSVPAGVIRGSVNGGALGDTDNYSRATLRLNVPPTAQAGLTQYLIRVSFQFV